MLLKEDLPERYQDIIIIGAGCVGQGLAASLLISHPLNRIFLMDSVKNVARIKANGIHISGAVNKHFALSERFNVVERLEEKAIKAYDLAKNPCIFIATKTMDAVKSLHLITDILFYLDPIIVALQNGLGTEKTLRSAVQLFNIPVLEAYVFSALYRKKNSIFVYAGRIIIEQYLHEAYRLPMLWGMQDSGIFRFEMTDRIMQTAYKKLIVNCICNPLTVIFNKKIGFLKNNYQSLIWRLCVEYFQLVLVAEQTFASCESLFNMVLDTMAQVPNHYSSMYLDVQQARKTEINEINGAVVQLGLEKALAMPLNAFLVDSITKIESLRRECTSAKAFYRQHRTLLDGFRQRLSAVTFQ